MPQDPETMQVVPSNTEAGTSIVELMIIVVIVTTALGAILSMCIRYSRMQRVDEELNLAFLTVRSHLDEIRSLPISDVLSLHGKGFPIPGPEGRLNGLHAVPGDPDDLPGQFSVVADLTLGAETLYRVRAEAHWSGVFERQSFAMETLLTPRR